MWSGTVDVDLAGIVLFDPGLLTAHYGGELADGTDLFTRYRTTDEGDVVVRLGLVLPILSIDDGGYPVCVRRSEEPHPGEPLPVVVENGVFPLGVGRRLVIADVAVLWDWQAELGWHDVEVAPGIYAATVRGYCRHDPSGHVAEAGFDICVEPRAELPAATCDLGMSMQVIRPRPGAW